MFESPKSVHRGHFDHEGEEVVDECIEEFVAKEFPWQVSNTTQAMIDEQLQRK
jgi:hypothetical protein